MTPINLPPLKWFYYDVAPRKLKITNTGHTAVLSAKWQMEQLPFVTAGPLNGNYVFSQMHFHWGQTEIYGSEHRADNANTPMELHAVHFNTQYLKLEEALRQVDGVIIIVYFMKLQAPPNIFLKDIIDALSSIRIARTSSLILQIDEFRKLCDINGKAILENCRPLSNRQNRNIFHVCPSSSLHATLLPISRKQLVLSSKIIADSDNPTREII
ncbi:carbonic anhydrase 1-like [Polistes fuscatus]|uniref:carbonic anhydrase 1-like n=1 Tax=Polistes fuscatus TaxID=30207 RepID=UPI001CA81ED0|nr:carbonic anhydrase 1-like [Polistes fuscatus]